MSAVIRDGDGDDWVRVDHTDRNGLSLYRHNDLIMTETQILSVYGSTWRPANCPPVLASSSGV